MDTATVDNEQPKRTCAPQPLLIEPRLEQGMEHRWGPRRVCEARVRIAARGGIDGAGKLRNISLSGAFLETALRLPMFAQLELTVLRADGTLYAVDFPAVVMRQEADGVGVEWCDPHPGRICRAMGCTVECVFVPYRAG